MKKISQAIRLFGFLCIPVLLNFCAGKEVNYSRGTGIYPGDPSEDFSPVLKPGESNYRNIAYMRPAWHSSSYDYNLTAQLVTDGIVTDIMPSTISCSTSSGPLPKNQREWLFDFNTVTTISVEGTNIWLQLDMDRSGNVPEVTAIKLDGQLTYDKNRSAGWEFACTGSNDGKNWDNLGKFKGSGLPGQDRPDPFAAMFRNRRPGRRGPGRRLANPFAGPGGADSTAPRPSFTFNFRMPEPQRIINSSFTLSKPVAYKSYRVSLSCPCAKTWTFGEIEFMNGNTKLKMTPSGDFKSAWMSAGTGEEWVMVDLGVTSTFDNIKLHWINKATKGSIQVSDDARNWKEYASLPGGNGKIDDLKPGKEGKGRYLRVIMTEPAGGKRYILSELEVYGKGGLVPEPKPEKGVVDNRMYLSGGNWKLLRAPDVTGSGESISRNGFDASAWVTATVPGTVLVSYWNTGALPDPNFGDNQLMISESFFNCDFWYRDEFKVPSDFRGEHMFLNFDGVNWKADVYVNGKKTGRIEGAFIRGKFDVTDFIIPGGKNTIAVLIHKNDNPGIITEQTLNSPDRNGGVLGADNPTFHASIGWDWIPTIRGRNIGIWNDVYLSASGAVTIQDPLIITDLPLPDTNSADLSVEVTLINHDPKTINGTLTGNYGRIQFGKAVTIDPGSSEVVRIDPAENASLHLINPKLWWPKGYGRQNLYEVRLAFKTEDGAISDKTEFLSGVREMSFNEDNDILNIYINGRRFIGRGGNWGFSESNLEYRSREYDIAVAYHADMNFTMIRNWVGQTGDDEFFDACDRYGVMVWQDFWLANPVDGPDPDDPAMFIRNADDFIKRIRNHPSIGLYCGRNEGNPPPVIDSALRKMISELHPGMLYIANSAMGVVSGGGPYRALPVRDYFLLYGYNKFHSERGMPNVMNYESLTQMLPESALWPQNYQWGIHDYCVDGAQGASSFNQMIEKGFGPVSDAKKFTELAQWINYNGYRGMFEGRSQFRQGLLLWMSHPAWPSMVWQTYDYYFDPTAAYFGCKKASEPIHIQWNPVYDFIEVVNYSAGNKTGLKAKASIINMDGSVQWENEEELTCSEDSTVRCFKLEFPKTLSQVHFIKLTLTEGGRVISDNFYWRGLEDGNYQALNQLPKATLSGNTKTRKSGKEWLITTTVKNTSGQPALMIRLKVTGKNSNQRMLPVFYSDNYISLMPGEEKVITMRLKDADTRGERPKVDISGFNL
jgi:Glycosyl hydrolase 2 galactose-binding domain-like/Exo-beta-D-glucosaminidase Ig-fold domain/F5/8 type C domain/Glycosyl hydrolases family 2